MSETTTTTTAEGLSFAPGTPSWVDQSTSDVPAAKAFYTGLFGWDAMDLGEEAGGYVFFTLDGKVAAATGPLQEGAHPAWSVYFNSTDADATAAKVTEAGGKIIVPPFDVMDQGRMAVFTDTAGAFFSVWQSVKMPGLGIKDQPDAFGWCELNTRGVGKAAEFYAEVFGWAAHKSAASTEETPYTEWQLDGQSFGGGVDMSVTGMPAEIPPHWLVYFIAADIDATFAKVTELGGSVMTPPTEYPGGKFAVVADPAGCAFGLMTAPS